MVEYFGGNTLEKKFADFYDEMMIYVDYDKWAKLIDNRIREFLTGKKIMEIGCGTGEILQRLAAYGYEVSGIDISEEMLRIAKSKYDSLDIKKEDMRIIKNEFEFDGVVCVFDALNYLQSFEELKLVFENIKRAIKPNGIFLFDLLNRKMIDSMFPEDIFADDRENMSIIWKHSYNEETDLDKISTSFFIREEKNVYKRYDEIFYKKIYSSKKILQLITEVGFELISKEVNIDIAGPRMIYLLKRVD